MVTGLPAIDYRLTDRVIDPEATANPGGDTTIRLAGRRILLDAPGGGTRAWPAAVRRNPTHHLWLHDLALPREHADHGQLGGDPPTVTRGQAARGSKGSEMRLPGTGWSAPLDFLASMKDRVSVTPYPEDAGNSEFWTAIDIALDTQPWNSVQDSCSALWMGVPVLTMRGETAAGRLGASLLIHAGLSDLVAETRGRQVEAAVALARDSERLAELRRTLRDKIKTSPLGDGARLARELEAAYRRLWRRWCRSGPEAIGPTPDGEETSDAAGSRAAAVAGVEPTEAKKLLLGSRLARQGWAPVTTETGHGVETSRMGRPQPLRERHHRGDLCAQPVGAA